MMVRSTIAALAAAGCLTGAAWAALPSAAAPAASAEHKLRLVKLLLAKSPALLRIPQSNNAQAKDKLALAQALFAKAQAESSAGHAPAAILELDEALRQIVAASSLVPDIAQQAQQERARNQDLREAIRTFQALHKKLAGHLAVKKAPGAADAAEIGRIDAMLERADSLIAAGNQGEAKAVLGDAYKIVVSTLNKMLMAETIVYGLKFDSPVEEFRHELARNRSYEELIPIALAQSNPARDTAAQAEGQARQSRELRDTAQKQANGGNHIAAVKSLQDATGHLQNALRIAGVIVPQSPETKTP